MLTLQYLPRVGWDFLCVVIFLHYCIHVNAVPPGFLKQFNFIPISPEGCKVQPIDYFADVFLFTSGLFFLFCVVVSFLGCKQHMVKLAMAVWRMNGWKFMYGTENLPHKNLCVHSTRCTQCICWAVGSHKLKLQKIFIYKVKQQMMKTNVMVLLFFPHSSVWRFE